MLTTASTSFHAGTSSRGGALQVEREVQRGQDLADLLMLARSTARDPGQVERLVEDGLHQSDVPGRPRVRADREQQRLRRARVRLVVVEGDAGARRRRRDPVEPLVEQQPGAAAPGVAGSPTASASIATRPGAGGLRRVERQRRASGRSRWPGSWAERQRAGARPRRAARSRSSRGRAARPPGRTWLSCSSQRRAACGSTACMAADWANADCRAAGVRRREVRQRRARPRRARP